MALNILLLETAAVLISLLKTTALDSKLVAIALRYAIWDGGRYMPPTRPEAPAAGHSAGNKSPSKLAAQTLSFGFCKASYMNDCERLLIQNISHMNMCKKVLITMIVYSQRSKWQAVEIWQTLIAFVERVGKLSFISSHELVSYNSKEWQGIVPQELLALGRTTPFGICSNALAKRAEQIQPTMTIDEWLNTCIVIWWPRCIENGSSLTWGLEGLRNESRHCPDEHEMLTWVCSTVIWNVKYSWNMQDQRVFFLSHQSNDQGAISWNRFAARKDCRYEVWIPTFSLHPTFECCCGSLAPL